MHSGVQSALYPAAGVHSSNQAVSRSSGTGYAEQDIASTEHMAHSNGGFSRKGRKFQKQQEDFGQAVALPWSIASPPLAGQEVAAPSTSLPAQQFTQISHGIGPLFSGLSESHISELSGAQYSLQATNHYCLPRTSRALKIVHPVTHEELKFDFKNIKGDSLLNSGVPTAASTSVVRLDDNSSPHMMHSLSCVGEAPDQINMNMNTSSAHQSGTFPHLHQPGVSTAVIGTTSVRYSISKSSRCLSPSGPYLSFKSVTPGNLGAESSGTSTATVCTADPNIITGSMQPVEHADAAGTSANLLYAHNASEEKKQDEAKVCELSVSNMSSTDAFKSLAIFEKPLASTHRECDRLECGGELFCTTVTPELAVVGAGESAGTYEALTPCLGEEKYTREFLLAFKDQNRKLPEDFEFRADITELLVNPRALFFGEPDFLPNPERVLNCLRSGNDIVGNSDEDLCSRQAATRYCSDCSESDVETEPAAGVFQLDNSQSLQPTKPLDVHTPLGVNAMPVIPWMSHTKLESPGLIETKMVNAVHWRQTPDGQKCLILSPQTPLVSIQKDMKRSTFGRVSDEGKIKRQMSDGQKGLSLSPQTPPVSIQKAMKRSELGRVSDEEQIKQRQIKGILNKLTPQNFDKLFKQVKDVNVDSVVTLTGLISQISEKALSEPTFCGMYAKLCVCLAVSLPEVFEDGKKVTFKRVLLNKCQEEFQRGERAQDEADEVQEDGQVNLTLKELEEKHLESKRRTLGNILFIGELYKMSMLTERIMHECITKLLGDGENFEEENLEALCKLMRAIGQRIDHTKAEDVINDYFEKMTRLCSKKKLPARLRFMLNDIIDLRRNGWQERRKVEGPKKIEEVHRDALQERQRAVPHVGHPAHGSTVRASKGKRLVPASSIKMQSPALPTYMAGTQMHLVTLPGSHKGVEPQIGIHGSYGQFLQQSVDPDIQVAHGQPLGSVLVDVFPPMFLGDNRQSAGPGPLTGCYPYTRGPLHNTQRWVRAERSFNPSESGLLKNPAGLNRSMSSSIAPTVSPRQDLWNRPSMPVLGPLSDEYLRKKSESAIIEYFSAQDLKEAALCVEDIRSPSFHSTMVSIWILISLEKTDIERKLLVTLLTSLYKAEPSLLEQDQIVRGFEMVLESLEDLAIDVPKAPRLLAGMMGDLVTEGVTPLAQVGKLLQRDKLVKSGYRVDMLGRILTCVRKDKGDATMGEMCMSSGICL